MMWLAILVLYSFGGDILNRRLMLKASLSQLIVASGLDIYHELRTLSPSFSGLVLLSSPGVIFKAEGFNSNCLFYM